MGRYVNPGCTSMLTDMNGDFYIDKSLILTVLNRKFMSPGRFMCVSRPRRFGKTMVGNLVATFYSKGADARPIFEKLGIASVPGWDDRLNKCNVIKLDMNAFCGRYKKSGDIITHLTADVVREMIKEFPDADIEPDWQLSQAIIAANEATSVPFVVVIDEYDVMVRENVPADEFGEYLTLLNDLFKSADCGEAIALAYITGIIPIVKDRVQSKLNNFIEYTMLDPQELAPFIGFTLPEVKSLCDKFSIDYDECLRWYDGYHITPEISICNSNSVCRLIMTRRFANYWSHTGAYAAISDYIRMDFDGIKQDLAAMVGGGSVAVNVTSFSNTLSDLNTKDKVFTYLIHLGYLTYDEATGCCRIPNGEIRGEWKNAIEDMRDMGEVFSMIRNSDDLLDATLRGDEQAVAEALDKAHAYVTSPRTYNNEGALQSAVGLAYFSATSRYTIVKELAAGYGFADLGFIPYVAGVPAMVVELKMNQAPEVGLAQIKKKGYASVMRNYRGPVVIVAVAYDRETKFHSCRIERAIV